MPTDFDFFRAHPTAMDFSPLMQGGLAMGRGISEAGQAVGAGLIERARMREKQAELAEKRRQFNVEQAVRGMLTKAQMEREARLAADSQARLDAQDRRLDLAEQREGRIAQNQQNEQARLMAFQRAAQSGDPQNLLSMLPFAKSASEYANIVSTAQGLQMRQEKAAQAEAQRQEVEQAKQAAGTMLQGYVKQGIIPKQMEPIFAQELQLDPKQALSKMLSVAGEYANEQYDLGLIDRSIKGLGDRLKEREKQRQERIKTGLPAGEEVSEEAYKELAALEATPLRGPALEREVARIRRVVEGVQERKPQGESKPTVVLPGGGKREDSVGFSRGGNTEDLVNDPKLFAFFQSAAQESAEKDRRYPSEAVLRDAVFGGPPEGAQERVLAVQSARDRLVAEHGAQLLAMNGWKRGSSADGGGVPAEASGADPIQAIVDDIKAGRLKAGPEIKARADAAGVSFEQIKARLGGQ